MTFDDASEKFTTQLAGALDWWREAGVDYNYGNAPERWLDQDKIAKPVASDEPSKSPSQPLNPQSKQRSPLNAAQQANTTSPLGGDKALWPNDVDEFREWWLSEPSLDMGGLGPRIAPRGDAGAALMIVVAQPEEQDRSTLLSGPQGALIDSMLRAMNIESDNAYLAAALPKHVPMADLTALDSRGLGEILRHHIDLVAPERLLILGPNILPLIGHNMAQGAPVLRQIYQGRLSIPVMVTGSPVALLNQAANRAQLWQEWLDWTAAA